MHENLELLDQRIDDLDPSPGENLTLFNHMIGALAAVVEEQQWAGILDRAVVSITESRATRS